MVTDSAPCSVRPSEPLGEVAGFAWNLSQNYLLWPQNSRVRGVFVPAVASFVDERTAERMDGMKQWVDETGGKEQLSQTARQPASLRTG